MTKHISMLSLLCMVVSTFKGMDQEKITPHQLDFSHLCHELGMQAGTREAQGLLPITQESQDLLKPLFTKLDFYTEQLKVHLDQEIKSQFQGFVTGFTSILFHYNNEHSTAPIQLDEALYKELVAKRQATESDVKTQKGRKELVQLLTATLANRKLLTLAE